MTEQLRHAIEAMQRLPDEAQNAIAARILEALEEDKAGKTEDGGFDCL